MGFDDIGPDDLDDETRARMEEMVARYFAERKERES
jgi:hypothetical protein